MQKNRVSNIARKTKETNIFVKLNIDGKGKNKINTGIGLLDHMLELFSFFGFFDLEIKAIGDLNVDLHHTNEDVGIVLGQAFKRALKDKKGIKRFGFASVPMEDVLATVVLDISGRAHFKLKTDQNLSDKKEENYSFLDAQHFFESFAKNLGINLIIILENTNQASLHTILEPVFKALAIALDNATGIDKRRKGIPSTKGIID